MPPSMLSALTLRRLQANLARSMLPVLTLRRLQANPLGTGGTPCTEWELAQATKETSGGIQEWPQDRTWGKAEWLEVSRACAPSLHEAASSFPHLRSGSPQVSPTWGKDEWLEVATFAPSPREASSLPHLQSESPQLSEQGKAQVPALGSSEGVEVRALDPRHMMGEQRAHLCSLYGLG